jgi:hypothetical protein
MGRALLFHVKGREIMWAIKQFVYGSYTSSILQVRTQLFIHGTKHAPKPE